MKVDVLVLTHNRLDVTKRFVEALYQHTPEFELYVYDNGSTDSTPAYLDNLHGEKKNVTLVLDLLNQGVIKGRNELYEMWQDSTTPLCDNPPGNDRGDYLVFLDNDQIVKAGWVDSYQRFFDRGYDIVGWEAWLQHPNGPRKFFPVRRCEPTTPFFHYVGAGGLMARWEVFEKTGLFDERFHPAYFEDPDFCYRAYNLGYKIGWNPTDLIEHEAHSTLGRDPDWNVYFRKSYAEFKRKWGSRPLPVIRHEDIT